MATEADIANQFGVSRQTVRRAFQDLVAEGLVYRVPGRGTFATESTGQYLRQFGSVDDLMALSADSEMEILIPLGSVVDPSAASRLRLSDDRVARTTFLRRHRGEAFSHTTVFLPPAVGAKLSETRKLATAGTISSATVIELLDQVLEAPIQDADQSITVDDAPAAVTESLGLRPLTAALRIDRMYLDTARNPVELAISHFHPDRYSYRLNLRRHPA